MRRKDREVTDIHELLKILDDCMICRIAVCDTEGMYIVPLSYGYQYDKRELELFFHSAKDGRKIEAFKSAGCL